MVILWQIGVFIKQETLSKLGNEFGIQIAFFDGRGGPPARGVEILMNFMHQWEILFKVMIFNLQFKVKQ